MKELPILFSGPMVRAILAGTKTQTRRPIFTPRTRLLDGSGDTFDDRWYGAVQGHEIVCVPWTEKSIAAFVRCPYAVGDLLYVKEATWIWCEKQPNGTTKAGRQQYRYVPVGRHVVYCADHPARPIERIDDDPRHCWRYKAARFMSRWASRLTREVVSIRAERVQEISEEDAIAEGSRVPCAELPPSCQQAVWTERQQFSRLWDAINAKRGFGWSTNPWVWRIESRRVV